MDPDYDSHGFVKNNDDDDFWLVPWLEEINSKTIIWCGFGLLAGNDFCEIAFVNYFKAMQRQHCFQYVISWHLQIRDAYPEKNKHEAKVKKEYGNKAYQEGKDLGLDMHHDDSDGVITPACRTRSHRLCLVCACLCALPARQRRFVILCAKVI